MKDRLLQLQAIKRIKAKMYYDTPSNSWKKQLHKFEMDIMDIKIKIERLKQQHK